MTRTARGPAILVVMLTLIACAPISAGTPQAERTPAVTRAAAPTRTAAATAPGIDVAPNTVWMGEHYFSPSQLSVKIGTTVTWRMLGSQEHDVWSLDGSFHSPTMGPGAVYTQTFTKLGTFKYICLPHHGDGMFGEITVTD